METMAALIANMDTLTYAEIETHGETHILLLTIEDVVLSIKITEPDLERLRDQAGSILEEIEDGAAMARQDAILHQRRVSEYIQ